MSLTDHARAARIMAEALRQEARGAKQDAERYSETGDATRSAALIAAGLTLWGMAEAHSLAAERMDFVAREEAQAYAESAACTLDHRKLTVPKCPACAAPRAS